MKKLLFFLCLFTVNLFFAQIPSNGLRCWWPFNGNANDQSGNGFNGIVINATLTTDRFGQVNNAYHFNGIESNSNAASILQNGFIFNIGQPEYTISLWFKTDNNTQITRCLFNTIPHTGVAIAYNDNNAPGYIVYGLGPANAFWTSLYMHGTTNNYTPNQWYLVTLVKSNLDYRIYINGVLEHSYTNAAAANYNYDVQFRLSGIGSEVQTFTGDIDDFGLWNRALTQSEITGLFNTTLGTEQNLANSQITVFPNPAKEQITIDCGAIFNASGWSYKIVNTLGQEVLKGEINSQQNVVSLNTLNGTGVYLVKIYDASNNLLNTKKIVLQ
jgi:hypothetical protein